MNFEFEWPVYVALIVDSLLLGCDVWDGLDFMVSSRWGLMVRGKSVPCDVTCKPLDIWNVTVVTSQPIQIPANHEMIVQVPSGDLPLQSERFALLEPLVEDQRGLMVARCLVDVWQETIPVRVMNISDEPVRLNRGYPVSELQPVEKQVKDVGLLAFRSACFALKTPARNRATSLEQCRRPAQQRRRRCGGRATKPMRMRTQQPWHTFWRKPTRCQIICGNSTRTLVQSFYVWNDSNFDAFWIFRQTHLRLTTSTLVVITGLNTK